MSQHRVGCPMGAILSPATYRRMIVEEAVRAGLCPDLVMSQCQKPGPARARWRVWRTLYNTGKYSLPGIGRTVQRDHSTVLFGIRKIQREEPLAVTQNHG